MRTKNRKTIKNKTAKLCKVNPTCYKLYEPFVKDYIKNAPKELSQKNHKQLMKTFVRKLNIQYAPSKVTAQSDFYTYINYKWIKNDEIDSTTKNKSQGYITEYDDFRIVQDKVYGQLNGILKDYVKKNHGAKANAIKNFYSSVVKLNDIHVSKKYLDDFIEYLDEMRKDKNNIWKLLGTLNKNEMIKNQLPFSWAMPAWEKDSSKNKLHINPVQLPILDLKAYYEPNNLYKKKYIQMCKRLFKKCLGITEKKYYMSPFNISVKLFTLFACKGPKGNEDGYNLITKTDALKIYGFDFETFAKSLGYPETPDSFVCSQLNYLQCCSKLLMDEWDSEEWRGYWINVFLRQLARCTKGWRNIFNEYYGIVQQGEESTAVSEIRAIIYSTLPFNELLTNEYIKNYEDEVKVEYVKGLTDDLKQIFIRIVQRNTWLSPKTKTAALNKLAKLEFQISKPFYLENDPNLEYSPTDFWQNMNKIFEWRTKKFISLDNKQLTDLPMLDFNQSPPKIVGFQSYVVNAAFIPSRNKIFINLGYIQEPFVDLSGRGIEYLLAHIGFTIGHEMSHCLDNWGSKFDEKGNLHNWWNEADKKHYSNIQKDIIKQYEEWAKRDGIIFDASIGIGEDLADISGLAVCDEYLRMFQLHRQDIMPARSISYDAFYVYFAYQQRQRIEHRALKAQLVSNPHPLDKYRTNVPLSRSIIFKSEYNIQKGDDMYWPKDDTVW
jgi:predicted metalloendopeptidase